MFFTGLIIAVQKVYFQQMLKNEDPISMKVTYYAKVGCMNVCILRPIPKYKINKTVHFFTRHTVIG